MNIITIPKEFIKEKELVLVPRKKYEELLKRARKNIPEVKLTPALKKIIEKARKNRKAGNYLTFGELTEKLGVTN